MTDIKTGRAQFGLRMGYLSFYDYTIARVGLDALSILTFERRLDCEGAPVSEIERTCGRLRAKIGRAHV